MDGLVQARAPRFRADKTFVRPFELTERDLSYILAIGRHEVLQSTHLDQLFPDTSAQKRRRRLQLLFHAGYIGRPTEQVAAMLEGVGSKSMAYVLLRKGADLLADRLGITLRPKAGTRQLPHALEVSDASVLFEAACAQSEQLERVFFDEILEQASEAVRGEGRPWEWQVSFRFHGQSRRQRVQPDRILAARHRGLAQQGKPATKYFFLEADRASMSQRSRIATKFCAYGATFERELHTTRYGMDNMRVLFVTKSCQRADNMIETLESKECAHVPRGAFLFIDRPALFAAPSMLEAPWRDGRGEPTSLFTRSAVS